MSVDVTIVDSIMGSGKSQASITYMNEHPKDKFIYITPYLPEAARIKNSCPSLYFMEPSDKIPELGFSKTNHTRQLIEQGRNISSTHQMFRMYTQDMLDNIEKQGYTLIIDEEVEVLKEDNEVSVKDIAWLKQQGYLKPQGNGALKLVKDDYCGDSMRSLFNKLKSGDLLEIKDRRDNSIYCYWALPIRILSSFKKVIIMTYMFYGQELKYYLDIHNIPYSFIGTKLCKDGLYRFDPTMSYIPEYVRHLKEKIHICNKKSLNTIGDKYSALSGNWYKRASSDQLLCLKNNVYNWFNNFKEFDTKAQDRMWGSGKKGRIKIRGKGYSSSWVAFNERATNQYRNKTVLAYPFNVFAKPVKIDYFSGFGIKYDSDCFATSILVQWIWRSAIRDGKDVWIYIPSKRMRELLVNWISNVSNTNY